jgi:hypothetical protein
MKLLISFLMVYFSSSLATAQIYNSSVTQGTAGTGRAAIDVGNGSFINPATLVHLRGNQILLSQSKNEFAASISENSREIIFPGALGYVQRKFDVPGEPVMHDIRLTLAEAITGKLTFGLTAHYYQLRQDDTHFQQINGDYGLLYTPSPVLGLALVGYDILGEKEELPQAYRLSPKVGLGFNWLYNQTMRLRGDIISAPNNNFNKLTRMLGYEVYLNKWILARLGYQEDAVNEANYGSLGFGLDLPRFDINYAFFSELPRNEYERHSIDLALTF